MKIPNLLLESILNNSQLSFSDIQFLLSTKDLDDQTLIRERAYKIKEKTLGKIVHYRGLIELSNACEKDCLYCGIRRSNNSIKRYELTLEETLRAAQFAHKAGYGSIVIQTGERTGKHFIDHIEKVTGAISSATQGELGITLSCGEQKKETYRRWQLAGAHRYLLRIETSSPELYTKIHPNDLNHSFEKRITALYDLKELGYQVGTGVMVGLPGQDHADLARDLLFFKEMGIHMVGMGPYIEHSSTPLYQQRHLLKDQTERYQLALLMIAVLRIMMNDINIAAATALQAIQYNGREEALLSGANIIMPNITPRDYRDQYLLYENKPCTDEHPEMCRDCLEARIFKIGEKVGYREKGDSLRFLIGKNI